MNLILWCTVFFSLLYFVNSNSIPENPESKLITRIKRQFDTFDDRPIWGSSGRETANRFQDFQNFESMRISPNSVFSNNNNRPNNQQQQFQQQQRQPQQFQQQQPQQQQFQQQQPIQQQFQQQQPQQQQFQQQQPQFQQQNRPAQPTQQMPPSPAAAMVNQRPFTRDSPSPRYLRCVENCRTTSQYNPVCGTDTITYHNEQRLMCAINCGAAIRQQSPGVCPLVFG